MFPYIMKEVYEGCRLFCETASLKSIKYDKQFIPGFCRTVTVTLSYLCTVCTEI